MGNSEFLTIIKDRKITIDQSLLNCSSSKLREYYSSFKSICESFSITISEFIQIFGHNQKAFQAFDPKKKGRIDAIEMFTGLIIFSAINYEQKIKFLFEIFDFNEEGWLSYEAVTFLLVNACNSTYKILSISQTVGTKEIQTFLNEYFYEQSQIGLEKFIKWSRRIQEFMTFFNIIQHDFQPYYELKKIDKFKPDSAKEKCFKYKMSRNILEAKRTKSKYERTGDILHTFLNKQVLKQNQKQVEKQAQESRKMMGKSVFDSDYDRQKRKQNQMRKGSNGASNSQTDKLNIKDKKVSKTKYNINFEFDNKFIQVLQGLVAPYEQKRIQSMSKGKYEDKGNQKQVNFRFYDKAQDQNDINSQDESQQNLQDQKFNPSLKWLYGIDLSLQNPIKCLETNDAKASNQVFIYCLNQIIILYYHKINIQKHYIHHKNHISTFEISSNKNYIASADFGEDFQVDFPEIHVWGIKARRPIVKFTGLQKGKIHKLCWARNDRNLCSLSWYDGKWALKILDVLKGSVLLSTYIDTGSDMIQNISNKANQNAWSMGNFSSSNPLEFIDIIECRQEYAITSKKQPKGEKFYLIYTYNSVTYLFPKDQQEQASQDNMPVNKEYSMVTKNLSQNSSWQEQSNNNKFANIFSNLIQKDTSPNTKPFPSIIQVLEYENSQFLAIHNDRKVRLWDRNFDHYEVIYSRPQNEKPFFKMLLVQLPDDQKSTTKSSSEQKTSIINRFFRAQDQKNQSSSPFQKPKLLMILDQEKVEVMNIGTKITKTILIPEGLYNLMLINMELIQTRKKQTSLIVLSLFGDVIRVLNLNILLYSMWGIEYEKNELKASSKSKTSALEGKRRSSKNSLPQSQNQSKKSQDSIESSQQECNIRQIQQPEKLITFKKYYQIFSFQKCKDYYFYEEYCLIIADNFIYKINTDEKELTSLMVFDYELKAITGFGNYYALLTQEEPMYVYILHCDQVVQKIKLSQPITAIKLIPTHLILCSHKTILIYTKTYDKYLGQGQQAKKLSIQGSIPVDICSTQNPFKFIVITQDREVYHLQIKNTDFRYKKIKPASANSQAYSNYAMLESYLEITYPEIMENFAIIFYPQQKFICLGMSNGSVRVWTDLKRIKNNKQANSEYYDLIKHQGPVKRMRLRFFQTQLEFITLGERDGMIAIYSHFDYLIGDKDKLTIKQLKEYEGNQSDLTYVDEVIASKQSVQNSPLSLDTYSYSINLLKDSQLSINLYEETSFSWVNKIISKIIHPSTSSYEPLSGQHQHTKANLIRLEYDHIFGFMSQRLRHSVAYVHHYPSPNEESTLFKDIRQLSTLQTKPQSTPLGQTKVSFASTPLLPLNEQHENCRKEVIYFIDRLFVLYNPESKKERVYGFHKSQVSAFQIHPNKTLVCSAERAITCPIIHIWDVSTLVLLKSIKTRHKGESIFKIEFSRQGIHVLTLAGYCHEEAYQSPKSYMLSNPNFSNNGPQSRNNQPQPYQNSLDYISVEVIEWKYSNSILYRILLQEQVFTVKFNPYSETEICLGGRNSLKVYTFESGNLVVKEDVFDFGETITALTYSSALYGTDIESDIIVGTAQGNVGLYICGKLIKIKKIHDGSINLISLNELFKYKTILITGAQDQTVKVWDTKFNLLASLDLKPQLLLGKQPSHFSKFNFSPQSIDFYSCYPQKQTQVLNQYKFLVSTRSGHIIQAKISSEYQGLKSVEEKKVSFIKEKLSLETKLLAINTNFTNAESEFELCGAKLMITYSMNSTVVFLWNSVKNQLIAFYRLKGCPSVVKYDPQGKRVFIGFYKHSEIQVYKLTQDSLSLSQQFSIKNDFYPDNIVFSPSNNYLAIALILLTSHSESNPSSSPNSSCIQIYQYKDSWKNSSGQKKDYELKQRIDHSRKRNGTNLPVASGCVWMQFSASGQELLVLYSEKKNSSIQNFLNTPISSSPKFTANYPAPKDSSLLQTLVSSEQSQKLSKNSQFVLYHIGQKITQKKQKQYSNEEFHEINFYPFIKLSYLYYEKLKSPSRNELESLSNNMQESQLLHPLASQMAQYQKFIVIGTTAGEVIFVHSDFFCPLHKKLYKANALCKYFKLLSTPITKISVAGDRIFLSSGRNSSVLSIRVVNSEDSLIVSCLKDQFNEKITEEYVERHVKSIYLKRQYIYESRINLFAQNHLKNPNTTQNKLKQSSSSKEQTLQISQKDTQRKKRINLELYSAIGRNAIYKRNNIFVDLRENIISHTGCNLLILKKTETENVLLSTTPQAKVVTIQEQPKTHKYQQQFLKLDQSPFSTFAEISCLVISVDRRTIFAGTNEQNAKILVWDISTKTSLKQLPLKGIISVRKLGLSASNKKIAVIGLNRKGETILFFVDIEEEDVLAAYCFGPESQQINDIKFLPESEYSFLLCGNIYMAEWKYNGILTFEHYNIENPSDFIQIGEKNLNSNVNGAKKSESQVIFYSISFLKKILISAGSDGYLYIWSDKKIIKKQNAHPKSAILCLYASSSSKIFASGGADGKAIVWQLSSSSIIQKMFQFSIYHGRDQKIPIRYHIQSVCISKNNIIVGTRAGQIYEFLCNDIEEIEKLKEEWKKGVNLILPAYDDDIINSISFNTSSEKLFLITQSGNFSVFDVSTLEKVKEEKIDLGKSDIIKMIVCKLSYRIFIILKNSVQTHYYMYNKEEKIQKFRKGKESFKPDQSLSIKNAIMSPNEKYLALLMASAQMDLYSIQLYDLTVSEGTFFKQFKILDHIPTNVEVIDFSTDNEYLICKNTEDEETIVHLSTHEIINPNSIEFQLQYSDQAKKTSKNIRDILQLYGEENQLLKIAQVMNHSIIATDEMGSVRVFEYPIIGGKEKQEVQYYKFYIQHLNQVYLCVLSQDCRYLATVGKEDRALFLWKVREA